MNYFEEYTDKLIQLRKGEKVRINVHFIISEPLTSFCYNINNAINKHSFGLINMNIESIIVPHISLFMGYIDSYESLNNIINKVSIISKEIPKFTLDCTKMYFSRKNIHSPQYLFIDFLQTNHIVEKKHFINGYLCNLVLPTSKSILEDRPHITVGCYNNITQSMHELINSCIDIPSCTISQIGVSITGKRGVCLSLLKVFDLE